MLNHEIVVVFIKSLPPGFRAKKVHRLQLCTDDTVFLMLSVKGQAFKMPTG